MKVAARAARMGRHGRVAALVVAASLAGAACLADAPTIAPSPTSTDGPESTPVVTRLELATQVWHSGFTLDFTSAVATLDPKGGTIVADVTYENEGADAASFDAPIRISAAALSIEPTRDTRFPVVPAGGTTDGQVSFEIVGPFDLGSSSIRVGRSGDHQAIVPLGTAAGTPLTFEPVAVDASGKATAGELRLTLTAAELRADLVDWASELPDGTLALTLTYDATYLGDFAGGMAFTADNVGLRLPDGTTIGPRSDGLSQSLAVLEPGGTTKGLFSRFEIPSPAGGAYALVVRDGATKTNLKLTLPAWP